MPSRRRPKFPAEWNVPNDPKRWVTWTEANRKLREEEVYWISTSSMASKPHAAPVWGIWKADAFYFETDSESVKGKNLRQNPHIVVHIQDGLDTVIVEGKATRESHGAVLDRLKSDYLRKYDYKPDWGADSGSLVFKVTPKVAHAWRVPKMHRSQVNFLF